jgi:cytoskeletal protein CcmA (bactofilin family)
MFGTKNPKTTTLPETRVTTTNNTQRPNATSSQEKTTISQGCFVQGEVSGTNDVSVFGKIDGTISLKDNILTIEKLRDIKANIEDRIVNIIEY